MRSMISVYGNHDVEVFDFRVYIIRSIIFHGETLKYCQANYLRSTLAIYSLHLCDITAGLQPHFMLYLLIISNRPATHKSDLEMSLSDGQKLLVIWKQINILKAYGMNGSSSRKAEAIVSAHSLCIAVPSRIKTTSIIPPKHWDNRSRGAEHRILDSFGWIW